MASVLVYIETDGGRPATASLQALGEGRRLASCAGATLCAVGVVDDAATGQSPLVAALSAAGADKILLAPATGPAAPPGWARRGAALAAACESVQPLLVLFAATAVGRDLGPRLAARVEAAFLAEPSIQTGPRGEVVLARTVYGATYRRRLALDDLERPVVATLTPGSYGTAAGEDEAEVAMLEPGAALTDALRLIEIRADPGGALESARIVVTAGGAVRTAETFALVAELARHLGAELGATRAVCVRGLADADREIGVGARHIAPQLYVVCGASGSSAHLGAVSVDAEIVAIDRDPEAPIFDIATYGIVGDLDEVLPGLIEVLRGRAQVAATS